MFSSSQSRSALAAAKVAALAGILFVAVPVAAQAEDLLDYVITAIDPTLAPARPLIECLAGGGDPVACGAEAAKKQAVGALPIGPGDNRVKKAVLVFEAARDGRWFDVVKHGGEGVANSVACAVLPLQGPVKATACSIVGWVISNNAKQLDDAYRALTGPDWWKLVEILGPGVCHMIPGEGPAGYAKDVLCGPLAAVLVEVKKWASAVSTGIVSGADALENVLFGDDSHMPYDRYFDLYWAPWYHYSTARVLNGEDLGPAIGGVQSACVDYFDSHNQYRSTAKKTCSNLRNKFSKHVHGFADALPVYVDGYFGWVARPAIRAAALHTYGKPATGGPPPGENFFVNNCTFQMHRQVEFPEPDEGRCLLLEKQGQKLGGVFATAYKSFAATCYKQLKLQDVQPTVWANACEAVRPKYRQAFAGESLRMIGAIGRMKQRGCETPDKATAQKSGLMLTCPDYGSYSACLNEFQPNGQKYCRRVVPVLSASAAGPGTVAQGGPVMGAVPGAGGGTPGARQAQAPSGRSTVATAAAAAAALRALQASTVDFEAEALLASAKAQVNGGQAVAQPMGGFGPGWSGGAQLFWHGNAVGATLDMLIEVPRTATWTVEIDLTRAPDYGELQFEVNGTRVAQRFDGYAPQVTGPVTIRLGEFALEAGSRRVSMLVVGRNSASSGWLVGVDRIRLRPSGD